MENEFTPPKKKKKFLPVILISIILITIFFGINKYNYARHHVDTDDAQIDGDISPVYSRVAGYVNAINFEDNQQVNKGDTLVEIDIRDLQIKEEMAEAALASADANLKVAQAAVATAQGSIAVANAGIEAANVRVWKANQDFNRFSMLMNQDATTKQKFDAAKAEKDGSEAGLSAAKSQLMIANKQVAAAQEQLLVAEAQIKARQADVNFAKLQISYSYVVAPASGTVSKKNVQNGQLINVGSPLCVIVSSKENYVIANFKETQLEKMKEGQSVKIIADAFPDTEFSGKVYRFSAATGAKFSILPPDNATGNFVKVIQRVPVKIKIDQKNNSSQLLRPGMSVRVSVEVE
ncbi:MAG: HlyD family secretion protein [Bacteroidota bacterium]